MNVRALSHSKGLFLTLAISALLMGSLLRTVNLGRLETFVDEGANILTSIDSGTRNVIRPIEQGRPLLAFMFRAAQVFPDHTVLAARATTVAVAILTIVTLGIILYRLAGPIAAVLGMWLWAISPFAVFHDRLALQDPSVTFLLALSVACVASASNARAHFRRDLLWGLAAGGCFGLAFLTKISALGALAWMGFVYLAFQLHHQRRLFDLRLVAIALGASLPVACLGSEVLRLGSGLSNYEGLLPPLTPDRGLPGSAGMLLSLMTDRIGKLAGWYWGYRGWTLFVAWGVALFCLVRRPSRSLVVLALAWPIAFLVSSVAYNLPYGRYTHPDRIPLFLFICASIGSWIRARRDEDRGLNPAAAVCLVLVGIIGSAAAGAIQIVRDPLRAPIPTDEKEQYVTGEWSGNGVDAIYRYLSEYGQLHNTTCIAVTFSYWRVSCYGLMLASWADDRVLVLPHTIQRPEDLDLIRQKFSSPAAERPAVFLLFEDHLHPVPDWLAAAPDVELSLDHVRADGTSRFILYHLKWDPDLTSSAPVPKTPGSE